MLKSRQQTSHSKISPHQTAAFAKSCADQSFTFIAQTPSTKSDKKNQRIVRSHARSNSARKNKGQVKSWILNQKECMVLQVPDGTIPGRVGTNFSLLDFPEPLQAYMENDIFRCLSLYHVVFV